MACFLFLNHVLPRRRRFWFNSFIFFEDVRMGKGEVFLHFTSHILYRTYRTEQEKFVLS